MELSITSVDKFKIVNISGKVDWENARKLDHKIKDIIKEGFCHIAFNLDEVTFICSGGVGALIYNLNKVKKMDGAIYLISSNEYVNYIFETLKFNIIFDGYLFNSFEDFSKKILPK